MRSETAFNEVLKYTTTGRRKTKAELADAIYAQFRYKCQNCGTNAYISNQEDKKLCKCCGYYVYKDKKEEFKEKLRNARKNYR